MKCCVIITIKFTGIDRSSQRINKENGQTGSPGEVV